MRTAKTRKTTRRQEESIICEKDEEKEEARGERARKRNCKKRNGGKSQREEMEEEEDKKKKEKKKKKEDSPSDLRYETLIKIISSASVECRGAYTTASRECNDLNGNNSVKDGCSRARRTHRRRCVLPSSLRPFLPSPRFSFCTNVNKKPEV